MRVSNLFFLLVAAQLIICCLLAVHALSRRVASIPRLNEKKAMARAYGLTDLCLFTEARYTRHPSLADLHSPFQDGPLSFEHFPSGSLAGPSPLLVKGMHD